MRTEISTLSLDHDDLRPISVHEFRVTVRMLVAAALAYAVIMLFFVP